jgi:adenine-specific DNA-methyltransferase
LGKVQNSTFARTLRRQQTDAEQLLWKHLRTRQINGAKFRRQQPIGKYVVDLVCLEKKLIIEIDGGQHAFLTKEDAVRTRWLTSEGYRVLRYWNNDVINNLEGVLETILKELNVEHPHLSPLPSRQRRRNYA